MKKILVLALVCFVLCATGCKEKEIEITTKNFDAELGNIVEEAVKEDFSEELNEQSAQSSETNIVTLTPVQMSELDTELELIEIESTFLEDKLSGDLTTVEMTTVSAQMYTLWDDELNSLWNRLYEVADKEAKASYLQEQRQWISDKETAAKEAGKLYEGGTLKGVVETRKRASMTRLRCYDIATYLGIYIGQTVTIPTMNIDGFYADTQGTMEAYSDLTIQKANDGFYEVEIGLYRLTTLSGYATLENNILKFVDESLNANIKGDITVENDSATFIITESDWEYLNVGEEFFFDEKWN